MQDPKSEPNINPNDVAHKSIGSLDDARIAARAAATSMQQELNGEANSGISKFALYMWGGIAVFCAFFAATSLVVPLLTQPNNLMANVKPSSAISSDSVNSSRSEQASAAVTNKVDSVTTGAVAPDASGQTDNSKFNQSSKGTFGVKIGTSNSVPELVNRYKALSRRAPEIFGGVKARVRMADSNGQLQAQLIAGPFDDAQTVAQFCRSVKLKLTVDCAVTVFGGDQIK